MLHCKAEYLALTDLSESHGTEEISRKVFTDLARYRNKEKSIRAFNSGYGAMLEVENVLQGDFERYKYLFVAISKPQSKASLFRKPEGMYIRAYCKGDLNEIPLAYSRILDYAKKHDLKLTGYAYEEEINELAVSVSNKPKNRVTQITVQCES